MKGQIALGTKRFDLGPMARMNRQKRFRELFRFRKYIRMQSSKVWCLRSQRLCGHPNFSLDMASFKI